MLQHGSGQLQELLRVRGAREQGREEEGAEHLELFLGKRAPVHLYGRVPLPSE
jgi:hypothetical protein